MVLRVMTFRRPKGAGVISPSARSRVMPVCTPLWCGLGSRADKIGGGRSARHAHEYETHA